MDIQLGHPVGCSQFKESGVSIDMAACTEKLRRISRRSGVKAFSVRLFPYKDTGYFALAHNRCAQNGFAANPHNIRIAGEKPFFHGIARTMSSPL